MTGRVSGESRRPRRGWTRALRACAVLAAVLLAAGCPSEDKRPFKNALAITTLGEIHAEQNQPYSAFLRARGGAQPVVQWSILAGQLPDGLTLDPLTGVVSGVPVLAQSQTVTLQAIDSAGRRASKAVTVDVATASGGDFTGFAVPGTDVWYLDTDVDADADGVSDFDEALVLIDRLGERGAILADVLSRLNVMYGNNADGTMNAVSGIPVSFTVTPPTGMSACPEGVAHPKPVHYNVLALVDNQIFWTGEAGRMPIDDENGMMENANILNLGRAPEELVGVFPKRIADYSGPFEFEPMLAIVCAHEIGHALGLGHNEPDNNTIMDAGLNSGVLAEFSMEHDALLRSFMPGANR